MKKTFLILAIALWANTLRAADKKPSILFCSPQGLAWGWIDLTYLKELHKEGFEVDYTNSLSAVTWDRVKNYNVLVLYEQPSGEQFLKDIERYVLEGGGVFLFPTENNIKKQVFYDLTKKWGAKLPVEIIEETDKANIVVMSNASYPTPLSYTDNIPVSPMSDGVSGVWYPISKSYNAQHTGPLFAGKEWQPVARTSSTSHTVPYDLAKSGDPDLLDPFIRKDGEKSPPFFAIRDYEKGRVALINQWRQYSVGSGTRFIFNYEVLSKGLKGKPSDFGKLLENTYRWLAQPSLQNAAVGGYETGKDTLTPPNQRENARKDFEYTFWYWEYEVAQWHRPPKHAPLFKGLIGAKTRYSSGSGSVKDYRDAAIEAGLDYVVFLEDFEKCSKERLAALTEECQKLSDSRVKLFPGYRIINNIGDTMFVFGVEPEYPPDYCLTGPGKTVFNLQPQDEAGTYTGYNGPSFNWLLSHANAKSQLGYYNFSAAPKGQKLLDLRCYSMAGIKYYNRGKLMEDVAQEYLTTAQGTIAPSPASINEVYSPKALTREVESGNCLTYAQARSLDSLMADGLRWASQYDGLNVFPSNGPLIHEWPFCYRTMTLGAEEFVTAPSLMEAHLSVSSPAGLKEIRIYDGQNLFRRFKFNGEESFDRVFPLDAVIHSNLVVIVEDQKGNTAVSSARRSWKSGGRNVVFCGDHVNDCKSGGMILGRGPNPMISNWVEPLSPDIGGYTWDGGPPASLPLVVFQESRPLLVTDKGTEEGSRFRQYPMSEFSDEGVVAATSIQDKVYDESVQRVINPWHTFGPIVGSSRLMESKLRYREYYTPTVGIPDAGWAGPAVRHGINAALFRSEITFKDDFTITNLTLLRNHHPPRAAPCKLVIGAKPGEVSQEIDVGEVKGEQRIPLEPGTWFGLYSTSLADSHVFVNRLQPTTLVLRNSQSGGNWITIEANVSGQQVTRGDVYAWELFSLGVPVDVPINSTDGFLQRIGYLHKPTGMKMIRGKEIASPALIDCEPEDYAVELSIPRPEQKTDLTLPLRIMNLNPRWTAGLFQKFGYVKGNYGTGENRYRPLGIDVYGNAYVPLYVDLAEKTHIIAGHPVVADGAGQALFIQVTHLYDNPHQWHVSVNNPTDETISTTLRATMKLPGLDLPQTEITVRPGEYRVIR